MSLANRVYSFPVFTQEFCDLFMEEIEHFESSPLPKGRPNTMNNYGVSKIFNKDIVTRAVVCLLFRKPVNLLQKTVGYPLTFIQSSDLYFFSMHAILLELDHQCVHM